MFIFLATAAGARVVAADAREGGRLGAQRAQTRGRDAALAFLVDAHLDLAGLGGRRIGDVRDVLAAVLHRLGRLVELLARLHAHRHELARDLVLDRVEQLAEQLEGLALVFLLGLLLRIAAQVDALAQVVVEARAERRHLVALQVGLQRQADALDHALRIAQHLGSQRLRQRRREFGGAHLAQQAARRGVVHLVGIEQRAADLLGQRVGAAVGEQAAERRGIGCVVVLVEVAPRHVAHVQQRGRGARAEAARAAS